MEQVRARLADTLLAIAKEGPQAFYEGEIAEKIAAAVQAAGGMMTTDDLKSYRAVERPTFDDVLNKQIEDSIRAKGRGKLEDLFRNDDTWEVK